MIQEQKLEQTEQSLLDIEIEKMIALVERVRRSRSKVKSDEAFNEVVKILDQKIKGMTWKTKIPGHSQSDIYQEALFALRFKAIKDYDQTRGSGTGPYPFDRFALMCIRRHLSTKKKAAYQNKQKALNSGVSLDQDQNNTGSGELLFLIDVLPTSTIDVLSSLEEKESFQGLFGALLSRLSKFEKEVLALYSQKFSYEEIAEIITRKRHYHQRSIDINVKSVDNALSRIKKKAKYVKMMY
jgi:DNA-directed RNA polymerase specialized sigma24 family protein